MMRISSADQARIFCLRSFNYLRRLDTIAFFSIIICSFTYSWFFSALLLTNDASIAVFLLLSSLCWVASSYSYRLDSSFQKAILSSVHSSRSSFSFCVSSRLAVSTPSSSSLSSAAFTLASILGLILFRTSSTILSSLRISSTVCWTNSSSCCLVMPLFFCLWVSLQLSIIWTMEASEFLMALLLSSTLCLILASYFLLSYFRFSSCSLSRAIS